MAVADGRGGEGEIETESEEAVGGEGDAGRIDGGDGSGGERGGGGEGV